MDRTERIGQLHDWEKAKPHGKTKINVKDDSRPAFS